MLSSVNISNNSNSSISNSSVSCWPVLEPALNQLFPPTSPIDPQFTLPSSLGTEDYLKLYTVVFDHCVGSGEVKKAGKSSAATAGLNISGEELYMTLVKYLETRFQQWSQFLMVNNSYYNYSLLISFSLIPLGGTRKESLLSFNPPFKSIGPVTIR